MRAERFAKAASKFVLFALLLAIFSACTNQSEDLSLRGSGVPLQGGDVQAQENEPNLTVYKTESCECCSAWIDHIEQAGFVVEVIVQKSLAELKDRFALPANARSCHTAVSRNGYVFEGHVPAKYIRNYLSNTKTVSGASKGLIVPAMPVGSPGMEYGDAFQPYRIFEFVEGKPLEVYAQVSAYEEQF